MAGNSGFLGLEHFGDCYQLFGSQAIQDEFGLFRGEADAWEQLADDVAGPHELVMLFQSQEFVKEVVEAFVFSDVQRSR